MISLFVWLLKRKNSMKIFDCSGSKEAPPHRSISKGPVVNDIMASLHQYCAIFHSRFVNNPEEADIIITNDIYPADILIFNKPRVKRMDGIFWQENLLERNIPLNKAALQSDHVIFISNYSQMSYLIMYGAARLNESSVVLNNADDAIFGINQRKAFRFNVPRLSFAASASNWARPEKRLKSLIRLARKIDAKIYLMGHCEEPNLPSNIIKLDYIKSQKEMAEVLGKVDAFINLSYRDAAPKVICQAINCKLPILYANSGGTRELVEEMGVGVPIKDKNELTFEKNVHELNIDDMMEGYCKFKDNYDKLSCEAYLNNKRPPIFVTLGKYFRVFEQYKKN